MMAMSSTSSAALGALTSCGFLKESCFAAEGSFLIQDKSYTYVLDASVTTTGERKPRASGNGWCHIRWDPVKPGIDPVEAKAETLGVHVTSLSL